MLIIKKRGEKIFENIIKAIGIISILPVFLIIGYIVYKGLPAISWEFLTEMPKNGMREGGIFPAIIGTIYLTIGTIVVSVPFGIFTGIYLVEYAKDNLLTRIINLTIINLAGIPSIIYGLFGMALFVIFLGFGVSIISGSLTLGGVLGVVAILLKQELILPIIGGVFVMEALSVILQVGSFKLRGKRIFKMAPIHHHFELSGLAETKVTMRFWITTLIFGMVALGIIRLRGIL